MGDLVTVEYETQLKAAAAFMVSGSLEVVSSQLSIPLETLTQWVQTESWNNCVDMVKFRQGAKLDASLTSIIEKATDEIVDRLENGDEVLNRDGSMVRVKVKAKDAMNIAAMAIEKRQLIRGQPTNIRDIGTRVSALAEKMAQIGRANKKDEPFTIEATK